MAYGCYGYLCSVWISYVNSLLQWKKYTEKYIIHLKNILLFANLNALFGFLEGRHRKIGTRTKGLFIILMLIRSS